MKPMKQQCYLWNVWIAWIGLPVLAIAMGVFKSLWAGLFILIVGVAAQIIYIKIFLKISRAVGYGSVEDVAAEPFSKNSVSKVTFYTANVCPFCPIVKSRLLELQAKLDFELEEIDVTFRPNLIKEKGFRSVPVIEADGRYWVGNATSAQIAVFLTENK